MDPRVRLYVYGVYGALFISFMYNDRKSRLFVLEFIYFGKKLFRLLDI